MTDYPIARAIAKAAGRERIMVGGHDITWFRADKPGDQPIRTPGYSLTEPFGYGASKPLVILRTNSNFEEYGTGDLQWLHKGAKVRYQRIVGSTVVTDYVGFITSVGTSGREFVAQVAGELSGRANLMDKPTVKIRKVYDLGSLVSFAMDTLGLHLHPRIPNTGITAANQGGVTLLSWLQTLCALSRTHDVQQRALMPTSWGGTTWGFEPKDVTTHDFTIFSDGARIQLNLVDDLTEQPTTVFGSGVTADGEHWDGAVYPGFFQGHPAPYPFEDDRDFGTGTSDGDTDTGDGITVMVKKLAWTGFLNDAHSNATTYDVYVARAVLHLQENAGLTADGVMTPATWLALWDADVVGFSLEGARIMPLAEESRVRNFNYSSTGSIIGRNPNHQVGAIRVDRTIDFGVCDMDDAIRYARELITDTDGHQWVGTIVMNDIGAFLGSHGADYAATVAASPETHLDEILPNRSIRPGMNAWLPYFDGGTLVHVSGVDIDRTNNTATLYVSTRGLDIFDITQALKRNQDSRRNVYREWSEANRGIKPSQRFISRDRFFGKLFADVQLQGGAWNIVQVVMGQTGTVSATDIRVTDVATEFCYAVFGKKVTTAQLAGLVGNPFDVDDNGQTAWEHTHLDQFFEKRDILTVVGQGAQPCGYGWKKGYDQDGDRVLTNPLIGTHFDLATWAYGLDPQTAPVAFLAIYPRDDCTLERGRLFDALEDDVT